MRRVVVTWKKLDSVDREYLLRRFRDEYPYEFWKVVSETRR